MYITGTIQNVSKVSIATKSVLNQNKLQKAPHCKQEYKLQNQRTQPESFIQQPTRPAPKQVECLCACIKMHINILLQIYFSL